MPTRWFSLLSFASSVLVLSSQIAVAQLSQPDETLPGFRAQDVLFSGTYDNVNAYNGDTGVVIPLGPSYALGKDFTFQVRAYNTLKLWTLLDGSQCDMQQGGVKDVTKALVGGFPTIGAAWTLSPGYVTDDQSGSGFTYIYVSPDGGHHPAGSDGITQDNSRLRISCAGTPWTSCTVTAPDGTQQTFNQVLADPVPIAGSSPDFSLGQVNRVLGLYQVKDAWSRVMLTVEYGLNGAPSWGADKIYLGATGAPAVVLNWAAGGITTLGVTWPALSSITFPAINGSPQETASFTYDTTDGVARNDADTMLQTASCPCLVSESDSATASVHQVSQITLKNGGTQVATFQMAYGDTSQGGGLTNLTLPSGAQVTYTLGIAQHTAPDSTWPDTSIEDSDRGGLTPGPPPPIPGCPPSHNFISDTLANSTAVIQRTVTDPVRSITSTTTYDRLDNVPLTYPGTNFGQGYNTRIVEVTEPIDSANSKLTRYLFHMPDAGQVDPSVSGVELEHSVYLGTSFPGSGAIRTTINCEDRKSTTGFCGYLTSAGTSVNQFPTNSGNYVHDSGHVTWYGDKPSSASDHSGGSCPSGTSTACVAALSTGIGSWVANGYHYEYTTTASANFGTNINRGIDTVWDAQMGSTWLLDLFTERTTYDGTEPSDQNQSDGASSVRLWHENNTSTGFVNGGMLWDSPSHTYLLACQYPDSAGAPSHSLSFSDSEFSTPPSAACATYFPTWPPTINVTALGTNSDYFGHDYTSQNGQLTKVQWVTGTTGAVADLKWNAFKTARDASTGLITTSNSTDSTQTAYTYDGLGRLTLINPPGTTEASTYVCYDSTTQTTVYRATSQLACPVTPGASTLTWHQYQYDGLGRLIREYRLQPDLTQAKRFTLYDAAGNAYFQSEWVASGTSETLSTTDTSCAATPPTTAPGTYFFCYDPLGRPQRTVGPKYTSYVTVDRTDGSISYSDTKEATTVACVDGTWSGTTCSGGTSATTTSLKDPLGRVTQVTEPSGDVTTYAYDVQDKLTSVSQGSQSRSFAHNAFGFLMSETTPEQGTATYTYGSLGNVREKNEGGGTNYIDSTYESASRLAKTCAGASSDLTCATSPAYIANSYDSGCTTGAQPGCGKLTQASGSNYLLDPGPNVTQTLSYSSTDGRLTGRTTAIGSDSDSNDGTGVRDGESISASEIWAYNNLGLVQTYDVPRLSGTYALGYTYGTDQPTAITAGGTTRASSVLYNPGNALKQWVSAGGGSSGGSVTTTTSYDASIPSRPTGITTSGAASGYNLSFTPYTYDGAGNVMAIGSDNFKYDNRSRLASVFYSGQAATCTDSLGNGSRGQCFSYDRYANLTNIGGDNPRTLTTSTSTNQLTGQTYDGRGNMVSGGVFDALDRLKNGFGWDYLFDAAGERVAKFPDNAILRREMAKLLVQARNAAPVADSPCTTVDPNFSDVACGDPDRAWIDTILRSRITNGCGNGTTFCPSDAVRRDTMAKFIVLALNQQAETGCDPNNLTFEDVPCTSGFWGYIQKIYDDGITTGCGTDPVTHQLEYCPANNVLESQMMAFTHRAWNNFLYVPRGTIYTLRDVQGRVETEMASTPGSTSYPANDFPIASAVTRDNVFLGNLLVASNAATNGLGGSPGWSYYFSDHLGTPRLISGVEGPQLEKYWPYGDEVAADTTSHRLRFATMERDTENNHFYDHARSHDFNLGRFVGVDKLTGHPGDPQSWNRYAYAGDNPIKFVDRTGLDFVLSGCGGSASAEECNHQQQLVLSSLPKQAQKYVSFGANGLVKLTGGISNSAFAHRFGTVATGLAGLIASKSTFSLATNNPTAAGPNGASSVVSPSGGGTVFVNPSTFANGPISRGGVDETETTSFVHELGHEVGSLFPERALAISRNVGRNFQVRGAEGFPVEFENRYRSEVGLDRREFYGVNHDYAGNSYLQLFPTGFPND